MGKIIDGRAVAQKIKEDIKKQVVKFRIKPGLAVVLVGENPASKVYVRAKEKACRKIGFYFEKVHLAEDTSQDEVLKIVEGLNSNKKIDGMLVQLPLPRQVDEREILKAIRPIKDVDGFHPENMGKLLAAKGKIPDSLLAPCTPKGIIRLIKETGVDIEGKNAVIVGRSNLVGKPVALLLLLENATVTICHSKTKNLPKICRQADILVAAVGQPGMITAEMVKEGAVVIDVGINRTENGLVGDVDFEAVLPKVSAITPVPGGVGPMTVASLLENTLLAYKLRHDI